jgi:hypothetical protein
MATFENLVTTLVWIMGERPRKPEPQTADSWGSPLVPGTASALTG